MYSRLEYRVHKALRGNGATDRLSWGMAGVWCGLCLLHLLGARSLSLGVPSASSLLLALLRALWSMAVEDHPDSRFFPIVRSTKKECGLRPTDFSGCSSSVVWPGVSSGAGSAAGREKGRWSWGQKCNCFLSCFPPSWLDGSHKILRDVKDLWIVKKRGRRKGGRARGMEGAWEAPGRPIAEGLVASSRNLDETVLSQMTPPCPRYTV